MREDQLRRPEGGAVNPDGVTNRTKEKFRSLVLFIYVKIRIQIEY